MTWRHGLPLLLLLLLSPVPAGAASLEIVPFQSSNRSPLVQIFGLPGPGRGVLVTSGRTAAELSLDVASNYTTESSGGEAILLDGESYRSALALRHGLAERVELGLELPVLLHRGGFLDAFIIDWHDTFHLPQGGRDDAPSDRLLYAYDRDGAEELRLDDQDGGVGDLRLAAAWQLLRGGEEETPRGVTLNTSLKLPTGDSDRLSGSGSTDLALWLAATRAWPAGGGALALYGAAGVLALTEGDVLPDRQRHLVAFGTLGGGWRALPWLVLKLQFDGHTPFYDSDLDQLGAPSIQLMLGGDLGLAEHTALELGVGEDVAVDTAPDVTFHLALRHLF